MSQPDYGFAQLNDSKYGHYVRDGVMDLALIRSPKDPDPNADVGRHSFSYAYYPHPLVFHDADVIEQAHEMNAECILWPVSKLPADPEVSHFAVDGEGVKLETVKHAEDTDSIVVRLYETRGARRRISLLGRELWDSLEETNLIEEGGKRLRFKTTKDRASRPGAESYQTSVGLEFGPFEIRTFRIVVKTMGT